MKIVTAILLFVALGAAGVIWFASQRLESENWIDEEHIKCSIIDECVTLDYDCGDCGVCDSPVNKKYLKIYDDRKKDRCDHGDVVWCDMDKKCEYKLVCAGQRCQWKD